jgi:tRNA (guanine37-N1)-methyltransferase
MRYDILSLFPGYFQGPFDESMLKRAKETGLIDINLWNIRDFAEGKHKQVDDRPYGGGPGMLMMADPVVRAIRHVKQDGAKVIYLTPQGKLLDAQMCKRFSSEKQIIVLCGHYEGIDARAIEKEVDEEVSIGNYVLTSGCPAAIVFVDSVSRFIPGVLGHPMAAEEDSFAQGRLEAPQFTRPREFEESSVPEVLLQGNHKEITKWRELEGIKKTKMNRPDLCESKDQ